MEHQRPHFILLRKGAPWKWCIPRYSSVFSSNSNSPSRPTESTPKPFSKFILSKRKTTHWNTTGEKNNNTKKQQSTGFASSARINLHLNYSTQDTENRSTRCTSGSKNTTCTITGRKKRAMQKPAVAGRADFIAGVKQEQKCSSRERSRSRISWLLLTWGWCHWKTIEQLHLHHDCTAKYSCIVREKGAFHEKAQTFEASNKVSEKGVPPSWNYKQDYAC